MKREEERRTGREVRWSREGRRRLLQMATWASEKVGTESDAAHSVAKPPSSAAGDRPLFLQPRLDHPKHTRGLFPRGAGWTSPTAALFPRHLSFLQGNYEDPREPLGGSCRQVGQAQPAASQHRPDARGGSKGSREVCILGRRVAERGRP